MKHQQDSEMGKENDRLAKLSTGIYPFMQYLLTGKVRATVGEWDEVAS
jgi:hypothetical protein